MREFFDRCAPKWDDNEQHDLKRMKEILGLAGIKEGDKVLDLACGTGVISALLHQRSKKTVYAIDLSPKMIEKARSKGISEEEVTFECADFFDYDKRDFDAVVIFNAYPHFVDLNRFKIALFRALKPGGRFAILHDLSRAQLSHCHRGDVHYLSRDILDPISESQFYADDFEIEIAREGDDFYAVVGVKKEIGKLSISDIKVTRVNKRTEKTKNKIRQAFSRLIQSCSYDDMTIEEILKEADVSRSTFYSYFKSKEDVLKDVCQSIFEHVFSTKLYKEQGHDFSHCAPFDCDHMMTHISYHFMEEKNLIRGILLSGGKETFLSALRIDLTNFMALVAKDHTFYKEDIPEEIRIMHLVESYLALLTNWVKKGCVEKPEQITEYFKKLNG